MKKLKVLLTNSIALNLDEFDRDHNKIRGYCLYPPVQLTTIAASTLKKVENVECEILDLDFEIMKYFKENEKSPISALELTKKRIVDKMDQFQPDLVGISVVFSPTHSNALKIAEIIKDKNPKTQVVCGGNHATFAYKTMLEKCPSIDFVFLYEGDNTFPLFIEYLQGKIKFEDLKGIAWLDKDTNTPKLAPHASLIEQLDEIPIPKWDLVPIEKYHEYGRVASVQRYGSENLSTYVVQTVRGCVAKCSFCTVRSFYGKGVRSYSAKRVLEEIDYLYNDLGIRQFDIIDDDFSYDRKRTLEICNGLIKRNYDLNWSILNGIRLGTLNEEVIHAMVNAKCRLIAIGVESGNDQTLAIVKKPLSVKMLYQKSEIFKQYPELYVMGNYIVGWPWESEDQMMNTFKVAQEIAFDWNKFGVFHPLPGTPLFQNIDEKEKDEFDFDSIQYDT